MEKTFVEMKLFQVKPDKLEQFESVIEEVSADQKQCEGCIAIKLFFDKYNKNMQKLLIAPFDINLGYSL